MDILALVSALALAQPGASAPVVLPEVVVDRDNVAITQSCRVRIPEGIYLPDPDNNGVVHVEADDITIEWPAENPGRELMAREDRLHYETCTGIGIRINGHSNVTIRGAHVHGYKQSIWATNADGLSLIDCDVAEGYAMRLGSTPAAEDSADWLWPHENDQNQWATNYGAAIWIEDSSDVTVSGCSVRRRQNALILENVTDSRIFDNDFSFLSGWGIAMWRSSRNIVSRNALDFCIRGYSHGVYNRGQDSAGLLLFEQCNDNLFIANSATHGGDGLFGFGGKEALGDTPAPQTDAEGSPWSYLRRGCNDNFFALNDFSFAAAHGLELTFSFGNRIQRNNFADNAICGIWGGYSQDTIIIDNEFTRNGSAGYGLERGGVNIEHSERNSILYNRFADNAAGIHLWHDADTGLMSGPWAKANHHATRDNVIVGNQFQGDPVGIHLRAVQNTLAVDNQFVGVATPINAEPAADGTSSQPGIYPNPNPPPVPLTLVTLREVAPGQTTPVGARPQLAGRHNIIMGEYFPWDHRSPMVRRVADEDGNHIYEILGVSDPALVQATVDHGTVHVRTEPDAEASRSTTPATPAPTEPTAQAVARPTQRIRITVSPEADSSVTAYTLNLTGAANATLKGVIVRTRWTLHVFDSGVDPREQLEEWRKRESGSGTYVAMPSHLRLRYGHGGVRDIRRDVGEIIGDLLDPNTTSTPPPGSDHFGTIAHTTLRLPPGRWRINTLSDDGIRVIVNSQTIIENWTWHGPTRDSGEFDIPQTTTADGAPITPFPCEITVEHFELDGYSVLEVEIEPVDP